MSTKLFVGSLAWATNDQGLQQHFSQVGTVTEARVIMDKDTGRSRGFGFVTMSSPEEAQAAISKLDKSELDGRPINVSEAQEKPAGDRRQGGFKQDRGGFSRGGNDQW